MKFGAVDVDEDAAAREPLDTEMLKLVLACVVGVLIAAVFLVYALKPVPEPRWDDGTKGAPSVTQTAP